MAPAARAVVIASASEGGGAAGGVRGPAAQPGADQHRRAGRGGHRGEQRVEPAQPQRVAADLGRAEPGALLGVAVDAALGRVDVQMRQHSASASTGVCGGQADQQPPRHDLKLAHVAPVEPAQERPQRRRCPDPAEQRVHPAVAQHVEVVDGVRAGDHAGHDPGDLQVGVRPDRRRSPSGARRPGRRGRSPGPGASPGPARRTTRDSGHRIARRCPSRCATIASRRCPSVWVHGVFANTIIPAQRASALSRHDQHLTFVGGSRLSRGWRLRVGRVGKALGRRALSIAGKIALQLIAALLDDEIGSLLGK